MISLEITMDTGDIERFILDAYVGVAQLDEVLDQDLRTGLEEIVAYAQYYAPVDKGRLRDSIRYEGGNMEYKLIADPRDDYGEGYAIYPEYGTSRQAPQPYMNPAIQEGMPKIVEMLKMDVSKLITGRM